MQDLLVIDGIKVKFGGVQALDDITLSVARGELCGLIGPNGAGKSTLFNVITGFVKPQEGRVIYDGVDVTHEHVVRRSKMGIRRSFQEGELFDDLTVEENLGVATLRRDRNAAASVLEELQLTDLASMICRELPSGLRRRVGVARALASNPRLLLLDEPGPGLVHSEVQQLAQLLKDACKRRGAALVLVDHDMSLIRLVCERVFVLDFGQLIAAGSAEEIEGNRKVQVAYLGL